MKQQFRLINVAAALLGLSLALSGSSALAASGIAASASISHSKLTVIDLTPDDGKAAGYAYDDHSSRSNVDASVTAPATTWARNEEARNTDFAPIGASISYGTSASSSSAGKFGEARIGTQLHESLGDRGSATGNIIQQATIRVDPHTQLIYSGYGEVSLTDATQYGSNVFVGEAVALVGFGDERWIRGMGQGGAVNFSGVRSGEFSLSFYNNSDKMEYVSLFVNMLTRTAYHAPSPVPEPETYAMLGLGMLVVGAAARRRRKASVLS